MLHPHFIREALTRFADNLQVTDDGILGFGVCQEGFVRHTRGIGPYPTNRFLDVVQEVSIRSLKHTRYSL